MIGFRLRDMPSIAETSPILPPFCRYLSVSRQKNTFALGTSCLIRTRSSFHSIPSSFTICAARIAISPEPMEIFRVSRTEISRPSYSSAVSRTMLYVPLSPEEIVTASTFSYPSALMRSKRSVTIPRSGSEVLGISVGSLSYISCGCMSTPSRY